MCFGGSSAPARGRSRHRQKVRGTETEGVGSAPSGVCMGTIPSLLACPWGGEGRDGRARNRGAEVAWDHRDHAGSPRAGTARWAGGQAACTAPCAHAGCAGSGASLGIPGGRGARESSASPAVRNQPGDTPFPPAAPGTPRGPGRADGSSGLGRAPTAGRSLPAGRDGGSGRQRLREQRRLLRAVARMHGAVGGSLASGCKVRRGLATVHGKSGGLGAVPRRWGRVGDSEAVEGPG